MSQNKVKHSSLTHLMRRQCDMKMVVNILARCDVSPRVGCLPPQLVHLVRPDKRADVTRAFGRCLENFFINNKKQICKVNADVTFDAWDIAALFNTRCVITARGTNVFGICPWSGGFGIVCKVSFPEIGVEYALKYFLASDVRSGHGAAFEIPVAFAANHAEPRDNCPIYMASLKMGAEFMLSKWAGDVADGAIRENKNSIYATSDDETGPRNWRDGRRIDYGETYQTDYGRLGYRDRKMFRKILRAADMGYDAEFEYMYHIAQRNGDGTKFERLMSLARDATFMDDKYAACDVIERVIKSHQR